jgi:hypothetical protein
MGQGDNDDEQYVILDRVDDPVVTHAHTVSETALEGS